MAVVAIVVGTVIVAVAMVLTGMGPRLVLVAALGLVVGMIAWLLVALAGRAVAGAPWDAVADADDTEWNAQLRSVPSRYQIPSGPHDQRTAEQLRLRLLEVMDDRLLAEHGIDRSRDPDAASAVMGDDLVAFAADPGTARSLTDVANVERVVAHIEQL